MSMQRYETSLMLSFLGTVVTFKTNNLTKDPWFLCCIKSLKIALKKHAYSSVGMLCHIADLNTQKNNYF